MRNPGILTDESNIKVIVKKGQVFKNDLGFMGDAGEGGGKDARRLMMCMLDFFFFFNSVL